MGFKVYKKHRSFHDESRDIYYLFVVSFVGMKSVKSIKTFEIITIHKSGRCDYERVHCPQKVCRIMWKAYGRHVMFDWNDMGKDL